MPETITPSGTLSSDLTHPAGDSTNILGVTLSRSAFVRYQVGVVAIMLAICVFHYLWVEFFGKDLIAYASGIFDAGRENSIPTWFSVLNLLLASGLLFLVAYDTRRKGDPVSRRWFVLAVLMLVLSMDEGANLHERLQKTQQYTGVLIPVLKTHPWVLYSAVFATGAFLYFIPFLRQIGPRLAGLFMLSGGLFLAGRSP
jgi:hypothetical protein